MESEFVPPDLWERVAKLDQRCHVQFARVGKPRLWRVTITKDEDVIKAENVSMARALISALLAAEQRGWPGEGGAPGASPPPT